MAGTELRSHATLIEPDLLDGLMDSDAGAGSLELGNVNALQEELLRLRGELERTQRDLQQAQQKIAAHEQERKESEAAARDLHDALAQYLSHQDAKGAEQYVEERSAVDSSWDSLEQKVMGLNTIKRMDSRTPRGVASPRPFAGRRSMTMRPGTPRCSLRNSISMAQDPIGNIGELVAKAARERKARQESCSVPEEATPLVPVRMQPASSPTKCADMPSCTQRPLQMPPLETPAMRSPAKVTPQRGGPNSPMSSIDSFAVTREAPPTDRRASLHMHTNVLAMQSASNSVSGASPSPSPSGDCNASGDDAASSCSQPAGGMATDRSSTSSHGSRIPALHDPEATVAEPAPPAVSVPEEAPAPAAACSPEGAKGRRVAAQQRKARETASTQLPFGRARRAAAAGVSRSSESAPSKIKGKVATRAGGASRWLEC